MKKIIISSVLWAMCIAALAQVPQGLNYQAAITNSSGVPVANTTLQVKAGILSDTIAPVVVWEELHSSVKTNASGVINMVIGTGTKSGGSAAAFSDVSWAGDPLFLKVQVNYQGSWKSIGPAKLWSVPYAMVADDLSGNLKKLSVEGETIDMEEALFEVKNKDGQTVFAVYNEGVRIYVDNGSKGPKGGFAVGGFGTEKAPSQNFLFIDPDSIRAYVKADEGKGPKGGFTVGGYGATKAASRDLFVISPDSIRAYIDTDEARGSKGGFAIGGFSATKPAPEEYLRVTRDSTRVYLADTDGKGNKGGFAIGNYGAVKSERDRLFFINPDSSRFYVKKNDDGSQSTFNIIGFGLTQRRPLLTANPDTVGIQGVLALKNDLIVDGNINVGGDVQPIARDAIDGDGYKYPTVIIGNQVWMAQNLRTTRYSNGELIGTTPLPLTDISAESQPKYQWAYDGSEGYVPTYGRLYTGYAATDSRNVCPAGYHIPSQYDWDELIYYLEVNGYGYEGSGVDVAKSMASTVGWNPDLAAAGNVGFNPATNNSSGFNALPAGFRETYEGVYFGEIGNYTGWWSDLDVEGTGMVYSIRTYSDEVVSEYYAKPVGFSIRCVQDK